MNAGLKEMYSSGLKPEAAKISLAAIGISRMLTIKKGEGTPIMKVPLVKKCISP